MSFDRGDSTAIAGKTSVLAIEAGGTNASTVAEARTNLGLGTAATTDSTAYAPAAQGVTNGDSHDHSGGDGAQIAYSSLSGTPSLGTISSQNANNVSITGGSVTGITDLAVADGGTGASTAQNARINLLPSYTGNANKVLAVNVGETDVSWVSSGAGTGDVVGPASSTDNAIVRFDGTTGKLVQNSAVTVADTTGTITTGGSVLTADGTVSAPAFAPSADTNTGIFFPAADTIAFAEGGVEAMRIDSSGNVGIGTSSPASRLNIAGSDGVAFTVTQSGTTTGAADTGGVVVFQNYDGSNLRDATYIYGRKENSTVGNYASYMSFWTRANGVAATERMRIDSSGNVGIGTSSPSGKLQVETTGSAANLYIKSDISTTALASRLLLGNSAGSARVSFGLLGGGGEVAYLGPEGSFPLYFQTNGTERMRIDSSGNVGIGTTSASRRLHAQNTTATTNAVTQVLRVDSQSSGTPANGIGVGIEFATETSAGNTEVGATIEAITTDVTATSEDFDLSFKTMAAGAAAAERMRVTSTGNLQFDSGYGSVATAYGCRAWVNFNGTGTVAIRASGNVTSITDNNIGDYTINFTNNMPDANYTVVANSKTPDSTSITGTERCIASAITRTTSNFKGLVYRLDNNIFVDAVLVDFAIFR